MSNGGYGKAPSSRAASSKQRHNPYASPPVAYVEIQQVSRGIDMMMIFTLFADRPDQSKPLTHKDILDGLGYPNNNDEQMTDVNFARLQPLILDACDEKTELVDQKQVTVYQLKKIYADLQETTANKQEFVSACYISLAMEINRGMPTLESQDQIDAAEQKSAQIDNELAHLRQAKKDLQDSCVRYRDTIDKLQKEVKQFETDLSQARAEKGSFVSLSRENSAEADTLREKISELTQQHLNTADELKEVKTKLAKAEGEAKQKIAEVEARMEELKEQRAAFLEELVALKIKRYNERMAWDAEVQALRLQVAKSLDEKSEMHRRYAEATTKQIRTQGELVNLQQQQRESDKKMEEIATRILGNVNKLEDSIMEARKLEDSIVETKKKARDSLIELKRSCDKKLANKDKELRQMEIEKEETQIEADDALVDVQSLEWEVETLEAKLKSAEEKFEQQDNPETVAQKLGLALFVGVPQAYQVTAGSFAICLPFPDERTEEQPFWVMLVTEQAADEVFGVWADVSRGGGYAIEKKKNKRNGSVLGGTVSVNLEAVVGVMSSAPRNQTEREALRDYVVGNGRVAHLLV